MKVRIVMATRSIMRDLVDKRLWPVAVLLIVAVVAVPIAISSSNGTLPAAPAAPVVAPPATRSDAALKIAAPAVIGRARPGAVHDPFYNPPKADVPGAGGGGVTTAVPAITSAQPSSPSSTPPATTTTTPQITTTPTPTTTTPTTTTPVAPTTTSGAASEQDRTLYRTRVRWGADETAEVHGLSRLQPLGGLSNPALLYLGTNSSGTRAAFLLGPNALSNGDSDCADAGCRVIALSAGDTRVVAVAGDNGQVRTFTLVVDEIVSRVAATIEDAIAQRARVNVHGRDVLREMIKDPKTAASIGLFAYDRATGAVVTVKAP